MAATHAYTELKTDEIRILHLQPGSGDDILQAYLEIISLSNPEHRFLALSWTWGDKPEQHETISLDGKPFLVRPTLHKALCALRKDCETVPLWIDAVCIDQESDKEKDLQIPLMADIYTLATEVYVWLGQAEGDSSYVLETLITRQEDENSLDKFIFGMLEILLRPWWTRTWVFQEYVLNKTPPKLFCGRIGGVSEDLLLTVWIRLVACSAVAYAVKRHLHRVDIRQIGSEARSSLLR